MVSCKSGFLALCKNDDCFLQFLPYHCIIHQQTLCGRMLNMTDVKDIVMKIADFIRARFIEDKGSGHNQKKVRGWRAQPPYGCKMAKYGNFIFFYNNSEFAAQNPVVSFILG